MEPTPTYENWKDTQEYLDQQEEDMEHFLIRENEDE